jgi:NADH-quinone oxidoreductase subunit N
VIGIMAALTCTFGNFSAYKQRSVKRLLAYSSIAHAGYMLMAAAVFSHPTGAGDQGGLTALLIYIVIYLFMNLGAFGVTALVVWETGSDSIESFTGLMRRSPWLAVPLIICLMSLIGLPPFAGFLGKWWILVALGNLGSTLGWLLVIVAVVNTLISVYYYVRLVVQVALKDDQQPAFPAPIGGAVLVNACALALLVLFLLAGPLKKGAERFSRNLFQPAVSVSADLGGATVLTQRGETK